MEAQWPNHLVIVRHGESERNRDKARAERELETHCFGSGLRDVDTSLTETGRQQSAATGDYLAQRYNFEVLFSSPYRRTLQTAEIILSRLSQKPVMALEERIREIEFGILDGLKKKGLQSRYPDEYARRQREGKYWYRPPGGESRPDVALRVHSFLTTAMPECQDKSVLVVCHSVVVLIFRRLLEHWNEEDYMRVDSEADVQNCSVTAYKFDPAAGKLVLDVYNKVCYTRSEQKRQEL